MKKVWWILIIVLVIVLLIVGGWVLKTIFTGATSGPATIDSEVRDRVNRLFNEMTSEECEGVGGVVLPDPRPDESNSEVDCGDKELLGSVVLGDNAFICCK